MSANDSKAYGEGVAAGSWDWSQDGRGIGLRVLPIGGEQSMAGW
ncbi:hypothetical protein ACWF9B_08450 [Streptomyces sp. NPDC055089]